MNRCRDDVEPGVLLGIVPAVVLLAAIISAALVVWAGRSPGEHDAYQLLRTKPVESTANGRGP